MRLIALAERTRDRQEVLVSMPDYEWDRLMNASGKSSNTKVGEEASSYTIEQAVDTLKELNKQKDVLNRILKSISKGVEMIDKICKGEEKC